MSASSNSNKKGSRTRGHEVTLVNDQCRLDIRKYSFLRRITCEWNDVSTVCVNARRINMFKYKIAKHLRWAGHR